MSAYLLVHELLFCNAEVPSLYHRRIISRLNWPEAQTWIEVEICP